MIHLGLTVYLWGIEAQDRLLSQCLAPAVGALRQEGLVNRFWFERMDIRGPHLFVLFRVSPGATDEVKRRLTERIEGFLATHPCPLIMSHEELRSRHDFCRGKIQCAPDRDSGFAENNTFRLFQHEERGYPFHLSEGIPQEEEIWRLLTELTFWTVDQLSSPSSSRTAIAVRWFAILDCVVRATQVSPERYWRYHASTLLVSLEKGLAMDEARVLSSLPSALGEKNIATLTRIWSEIEAGRSSYPWIDTIVELVLNAPKPSEEQRLAFLREIIHCSLKQLGLMVAFHLPLVLFAWNLTLQCQEAAQITGDLE
jgi:Lantibiotic biosynthesis dehydratase C-term